MTRRSGRRRKDSELLRAIETQSKLRDALKLLFVEEYSPLWCEKQDHDQGESALKLPVAQKLLGASRLHHARRTYHIEHRGRVFIVIDPLGERLDPDYLTIEQAQQGMERHMRDDAMYESAKFLLDTAIKLHMEIHKVDRKTTKYWVTSAMEMLDEELNVAHPLGSQP